MWRSFAARSCGELDPILVPGVSTVPGCQHRADYREEIIVLEPPSKTAATDRDAVILGDLTDEDLILVDDQCGLTAFTSRLFTDSQIPLRRCPGEAAGHQVLEEWTKLGLESALLPLSKSTNPGRGRIAAI